MRPQKNTTEKPNDKRSHGLQPRARMHPYPPAAKKSLILFAVASEFRLTSADLIRKTRIIRIDDARAAAMYLCVRFGHTKTATAELFNRSFGSISNAIRACEDKMDTEQPYFNHVAAISARLMQLTCTPPADRLQHTHD